MRLTRRLLLSSAALIPGVALAQPTLTTPHAPRWVQKRLYGPRAGKYGPQNLPTQGPSLSLDFTTGTLPSGVTFTRAAGPATYFDSTGTLTTAATNVPRFDYDPASLQIRGLLIEEARTNSIKNSTIVGAAAGTPGTLPTGWTDSLAGLTRQVVGTGTENGINYIEIRYSGTTTGTAWSLNFGALQDIAAANGQTWAESWYVRLTAGSLANINTVQMIHQFYDATPTFLSAAAQTIVPVLGGSLAAQRFTYANTIAVANTAYIYPYLKFNTSVGVAIDVTFRIGGVQTEQGAFATSYIPTTAAAATRPAESAGMTPTGAAWYNPSAFGVAINAYLADAVSAPSFMQFDDNTNNTRSGINRTAANQVQLFENVGGVTTINTNSTVTPSIPAPIKVASTSAAGNHQLAVNGIATTLNTNAAGPGVYTNLRIGRALSPANGSGVIWISRFRHWPRVLSNTELQQVTT